MLEDYDFIEQNTDLMYVDRDGVWHCVLVKAVSGHEAILSQSEGYDYNRYSGYIGECTVLIHQFNI